MASSSFIVKAANAMLIRSRKQTTKTTKIKGRILIRTLWSVLASIDVAGAANSLAKVHLGVRLPRPEGFISGRGWPKIYKGLGNSMPRSYTRQATRLFLLARALIALAVVITQSHSSLLYVRSELVCSRLETASLDCFWITSNSEVLDRMCSERSFL